MFTLVTSCNKKESNKTIIQKSSNKNYIGNSITHKYDAKIDSFISKMTLEEKVGMLHGASVFNTAGIARLGIPELKMTDGPLGIREEISKDSWAPQGLTTDYATYYPAGSGLSATWNPQLAYMFGNSVGQEARARDKDILLSPAVNIIRTPLGGRTYEYFTEDPFLNKKLAVPFIIGVQHNDVATCVKHYVANNQETNRDFVDVQIDERALQEIYLPAFKAAVTEAKAYSIMGAYNKFRGQFLCENGPMLNDVLKDDWDFQGIVISDWAAVHSTVNSLKSGLDIEMGTPKPFNEYYLADPLLKAIQEGKVSEEEVNKHIKRILQVMFSIKSLGNKQRSKGSINTKQHLQDAYDIASESVVLLKNSSNLLPLETKNIKSIAVIGANALKKNALAGYGAGVKTHIEVTPLEGLKNKLPKQIKINYAEGYQEKYGPKKPSKFGDVTQARPQTIDQLNPKLVNEALNVVKNSDAAIIFAGSNRDYETEGSDRPDLNLPFGQETLIEKILEINPNAIIVFIAGAPFDINKIKEKASAIVWSWFNGSEGGDALADVLLGNVNPSGKLPWTMPKKIADSPAHANNSFPGNQTATYKEGILVGYRWFDTKNIDPLYPFGYGLSYTSFQIKNATLDKAEPYTKNDTILVSADVENMGKLDGKEVVQLYVSKKDSKVERAAQELKGFTKVFVPAGKTTQAVIQVPVQELAYYNVENKNWEVEPGIYTFKLGNSSRNTQVEIVVNVH